MAAPSCRRRSPPLAAPPLSGIPEWARPADRVALDAARLSAATLTERACRDMVGLDALPHPAREAVVRFLPTVDALRALPFVNEGTLAVLKELRLPIGKLKPWTGEEALQQARAPSCLGARRARTLFACDGRRRVGAGELPGVAHAQLDGLPSIDGRVSAGSGGLRDATDSRPLKLLRSHRRVGAGGLRDAA